MRRIYFSVSRVIPMPAPGIAVTITKRYPLLHRDCENGLCRFVVVS